jgi:hypothetical protein
MQLTLFYLVRLLGFINVKTQTLFKMACHVAWLRNLLINN